mmetsp:Transcript_105791/g.321053  ORF Transcript_105791/g.321053 Transcript_105791/m.321053 type:complete len:259 (+) Transcript_105791:83-859(+)
MCWPLLLGGGPCRGARTGMAGRPTRAATPLVSGGTGQPGNVRRQGFAPGLPARWHQRRRLQQPRHRLPPHFPPDRPPALPALGHHHWPQQRHRLPHRRLPWQQRPHGPLRPALPHRRFRHAPRPACSRSTTSCVPRPMTRATSSRQGRGRLPRVRLRHHGTLPPQRLPRLLFAQHQQHHCLHPRLPTSAPPLATQTTETGPTSGATAAAAAAAAAAAVPASAPAAWGRRHGKVAGTTLVILVLLLGTWQESSGGLIWN